MAYRYAAIFFKISDSVTTLFDFMFLCALLVFGSARENKEEVTIYTICSKQRRMVSANDEHVNVILLGN